MILRKGGGATMGGWQVVVVGQSGDGGGRGRYKKEVGGVMGLRDAYVREGDICESPIFVVL